MRKVRIAVILAAIAGVIGLFVANLCMFIVHERDQVVVTRLNKPVHIIVGDRSPEDFEKVKADIILAARRNAEAADADGLTVSMGAGTKGHRLSLGDAGGFCRPRTVIDRSRLVFASAGGSETLAPARARESGGPTRRTVSTTRRHSGTGRRSPVSARGCQ